MMSDTFLLLLAILALCLCVSESLKDPQTTSICLPSVCNDTKMEHSTSIVVVNRLCCSVCDCNDVVCHTTDPECASDESIQLRHMLPSAEASLECMLPQLKTDGDDFPYYYNPHFMVYVCPSSYSANESYDPLVKLNIDKCERAETYGDFDTKVPVYDIQTGLTFKNKFCAACHNVLDQSMIVWTPVISCSADAFWPDGYDNIVNAIQEHQGCNILFYPPENTGVLNACTRQQLQCKEHYDVNATCNTNDIYTETSCLITYNWLSLCSYNSAKRSILPSFSLLLSYSGTPLETTHTQETNIFESRTLDCEAGTFYDEFKIVCRSLTCVPPKLFRNGACETMVEKLLGASFSVNLKMTPAQPVRLTDTGDLSDSIMTFVHEFMFNNSFQEFYNVTIYIKLNTDEVEFGTDLTVQYYVMNLEATSYGWMDAGFIDAVLELDNKYIAPNNTGRTLLAELIQTETISDSNDTVLYNFVDGDVLIKYNSFKMVDLSINTGAAKARVSILSSSGCPLVTLPAAEFDLHNTTWGIHISDIEANVSRWHFLENIDSGQLVSVMVCVDTYANLIQSYLNTTNFTLTVGRLFSTNLIAATSEAFTVGVMSLICTCLSVMCLLLTLLTYGLFKVMRTQPGINNMALCISLILAQTMFQFGTMQKDNAPGWACKLIGVLVHFFWLNAVLWMNVSSVHSFRVFWAIAEIQNNKGSLQTTTLYCIYAFVCSILPVAASLVANSVSDNKNMGYGKTVCYISETIYIQLTFAVPTAFFILINIGLFVAVVYKVRQLPVMSAMAAKQRQYLRVYFKLSSLTGFLWVFGFVHMFTGEPALEYIFIVFNASQGVFIFGSFACTKSVFRMYLGLFNNYAVSSAVSTKVTDSNTK